MNILCKDYVGFYLDFDFDCKKIWGEKNFLNQKHQQKFKSIFSKNKVNIWKKNRHHKIRQTRKECIIHGLETNALYPTTGKHCNKNGGWVPNFRYGNNIQQYGKFFQENYYLKNYSKEKMIRKRDIFLKGSIKIYLVPLNIVNNFLYHQAHLIMFERMIIDNIGAYF
jgi:hypothetical protein